MYGSTLFISLISYPFHVRQIVILRFECFSCLSCPNFLIHLALCVRMTFCTLDIAMLFILMGLKISQISRNLGTVHWWVLFAQMPYLIILQKCRPTLSTGSFHCICFTLPYLCHMNTAIGIFCQSHLSRHATLTYVHVVSTEA